MLFLYCQWVTPACSTVPLWTAQFVASLQEPGRSACPVSTRSAGSWWRPAGTGTPPWGPCSASWSPACKASWCGCATATPSRRAAAWRTQTKKQTNKQKRQHSDKLTHTRGQSGIWGYLCRAAMNRWPVCDVRAFLLVPSVGILFMRGWHGPKVFTHFIVCALCICIQTLQEAFVMLIATWS